MKEYTRKPMERNRGRFTNIPEGLDTAAENVAKMIVEKYDDIDIIDLSVMFTRKLNYYFGREIARASMEE